MRRSGTLGAVALAVGAATALVCNVQPEAVSSPAPLGRGARVIPDRAPPPGRPLRLLFIHHSVGSQLLADPGPGDRGTEHPNGGGLRRLLAGAGYVVGSVTSGSRLGERTDLFDWPEKFANHLPELLRTAEQDQPLPEERTNDILLFKSCFPNSAFVGLGTTPGNPRGPELTVENAKAAMRSLLPHFRNHPKTLFVYLTAPPQAARTSPERAWRWILRALRGRSTGARMAREAELARAFNDWVVDRDSGWLAGYELNNVAAIDYYDLLTGNRTSNFLVYPSGDGSDSHPTGAGQTRAAPRILMALNDAVSRAGLAAPGDAGRAP